MVGAVARDLRQRILQGEWAAGEALPAEGALAESFGVSRTVAREALRTLSGGGLVDIAQGRTARVRPPDALAAAANLQALLRRDHASLEQLLEVRAPLESEIASLAARRLTQSRREQLEHAVTALENAELINERADADIAFHVGLAEATGNPIFPLLLSTLTALMRELLGATLAHPTGRDRAAAGHRAILAPVVDGDAERARREMLNHLDAARHDLIQTRQEGPADV